MSHKMDLITAVKGNKPEKVQALIERGVVGKQGIFEALVEAVRSGRPHMLPLLAPHCTVHSHGSSILAVAAFEGQVECLSYLVPLANPKAKGYKALHIASGAGHLECVKLLCDGASSSHLMECVMVAGRSGKKDVVQYLLTRFDPTSKQRKLMLTEVVDQPFGWRSPTESKEVVDVLYEICSVDEIRDVAGVINRSSETQYFEQRWAADQLRLQLMRDTNMDYHSKRTAPKM